MLYFGSIIAQDVKQIFLKLQNVLGVEID